MLSYIRKNRIHPVPAACRRMVLWMLCLLVLPVPMPVMHEHQSIESVEAMLDHLADHHGMSSQESSTKEYLTGDCLPVDLSHWHLVLPQACDDQSHKQGLPTVPADYAALRSCNATTVRSIELSKSLLTWTVVSQSLDHWDAQSFINLDVRGSDAAAAQQRARAAFACVMRI